MKIMYFFIDQGIEHPRIKFITVKCINCMQDYSAINVLAWSDVMTTYLQCTSGVKKKGMILDQGKQKSVWESWEFEIHQYQNNR